MHPSLPLLFLSSLLAFGDQGPKSAAPKPIASFAGGQLLQGEIEARGGAALYPLRRDLYDLQVRIAQDVAFDKLVEAEAQLKGMAPRDLVHREVERNLVDPTPEEITKALPEFRKTQNLPPTDAGAREAVATALKERARMAQFEAFRNRLLQAAGFQLDLQPPRLTVPQRPFNPTLGPAKAPVTLVVFSDFECTHCKALHDTVKALVKRFPEQVRLVSKQMPLDHHPQAKTAALAGLFAAESGKFHVFQDLLFSGPSSLSRASLEACAAKVGLDPQGFQRALDSEALRKSVELDQEDAAALGITGSPALTLNGRLIQGAAPLSALTRMVEEELRWAGLHLDPEHR